VNLYHNLRPSGIKNTGYIFLENIICSQLLYLTTDKKKSLILRDLPLKFTTMACLNNSKAGSSTNFIWSRFSMFN